MENLAPIPLALVVTLALAVVGGLIAIIRHMTKYRSYEALATEAQAIAKALHGQVLRDGADLVMCGNQGRWPVVVRWSHAETMPGLAVRMEAPASFTLWVAGRSAPTHEGRAVLRTPNPVFDARFFSRTDHPTQAAMMLSSKNVFASIQKLCCSANNTLAVTAGSVELTEHVIPQPATARHVLEHVAAMETIADFLKTMPGADRFKIKPLRRDHHIVGRLAIAAGVCAAVLTVIGASKQPNVPMQPESGPHVPTGVLPLEAARIANVDAYRVATMQDLDPAAVAWLRNSGEEPAGRITGDFSGTGEAHDAAYLLVDKDQKRRLVLLAGNTERYDVKLDYLGLIARVPKAIIGSVEWVGNQPTAPDGDGLLVVRRPDDPTSGLVLFLSGQHIMSAVPANYQKMNLR